MASDNKISVGIIPCAGLGTRLGRLPCSKELYPIGKAIDKGKIITKVASDYLIDHMKAAGISEIHFVLRRGKWDIPNYFGGGLNRGFNACYHVADYGYGVPFSVNQVFPFIKDKIVAFGFPDILFTPKKTYESLLELLDKNDDHTIVLGLMPIERPESWDMVELDGDQNVNRLIIKKTQGKKLRYGWLIAVWKPGFTRFLNNTVSDLLTEKNHDELEKNEICFGDIIVEAIHKGLTVKGTVFDNGRCLDIGTPEDLSAGASFFHEKDPE